MFPNTELDSPVDYKNKLWGDYSMEMLTSLIGEINSIVWGPMMLVLILGVGLFLMLGLRLMLILKLGTGFKLLFEGRNTKKGEEQEGDSIPCALDLGCTGWCQCKSRLYLASSRHIECHDGYPELNCARSS